MKTCKDYSKDFGQVFQKAVNLAARTLYEGITRRKFMMPPELRSSRKLGEALHSIHKRWPQNSFVENDLEYPVFILSAGWRSGSTLMQRLVTSSKEILIWGEALGDAAFIPRLGRVVSRINMNWPDDTLFFERDLGLSALAEKWIANLSPPVQYLRCSHRTALLHWLGTPAKEIYSLQRWGLKEVRLTIDHARYLKWLFPNARFIFIFRNLFDAYSSWKGNLWGGEWPGYFSRSPIVFGRHWRLLLDGFLGFYKEVDGILVKFEDLVSGEIDLKRVAHHIGVQRMDSTVLEKKVGSPTPQRKTLKRRVNAVERALLSLIGGSTLVKLNYKNITRS
jgi:hypothetical protein